MKKIASPKSGDGLYLASTQPVWAMTTALKNGIHIDCYVDCYAINKTKDDSF